AAARATAQKALELYESAGSQGRTATVRERALIARVLRDLDRIDEAAATLGPELPRLREAFGAHSQEYAVNVAEYAAIQDRRGDLASAAASIREALLAAQDFGASARSLYFWERLTGEIAVQQRDLDVAREHLQSSLVHAANWPRQNSALISEMLLWQVEVLDGELVPMPSSLRPLADDPAKALADTTPAYVVTGALCTEGYIALAQGKPPQAPQFFDPPRR